MKSRYIFPLQERLKNGNYTKMFDSGKNFEHLYDIIKKYHFALNIAENELFQANIGSNSDKILPINERDPFEHPYIGVSKMQFFSWKEKVKKYHLALESAENVLLKLK